ncbi:MAG: DUF4418 family protein [Oscillospiraceae bacterium]|jgi:hypothetical protein|nr:DUF4418 family protein [Oscillospiraceae bacterium]
MSKNRIIGGVATVVTGALTAVGPHTIFKICDQGHHEGHSVCFWTGQATIGVGIIVALLGVAYLIFASEQTRAGISLSVAATSVLTFLLANVLIGMDDMAMMACRVKTLPALNVISILSFALAIGNTVYLLVKSGKDTKNAHAAVNRA